MVAGSGSREAGRKSRVISAHTLREHGLRRPGLRGLCSRLSLRQGLVHAGPLVSDGRGVGWGWEGLPHPECRRGVGVSGRGAVMGSQASTPVRERGGAQGTQAGSEGPGGHTGPSLTLNFEVPLLGMGLWPHQAAWVGLRM